jgi:Leucine-rich repeat (LRR) protein
MKRKPCVKNEKGETLMTKENLKISLHNQQDAFETLELNESLHLQYYGFSNIDNLDPFTHLHTLYLNNNVITEIANLDSLT